MKRFVLMNIIFLFLAASLSFGAPKKTVKYHAFAPRGVGKAVFLKAGAKSYGYFEVVKGKTIDFELMGPTKIKITSRAELRPNSKNSEYQMQIWEGDSLRVGRKAKTVKSDVIIEGQKLEIGLGRSVELSVPKGKHVYRLWFTSDNTDKYYVRFYQEVKTKKSSSMLSYRPLEFKKKVTLPVNKKSTTYYLVDTTGGVSVTVVGPTDLIIYCRVNFDQNMKGNSKFTLEVLESGKTVTQFSEIGALAPKLSYKEMTEIIPSDLHKFTFNVPSGKHIYTFREINSSAPSLAVRFKISKNGIGKKL